MGEEQTGAAPGTIANEPHRRKTGRIEKVIAAMRANDHLPARLVSVGTDSASGRLGDAFKW